MESRKAASEEMRLQTTAKNRQRGCRRDVQGRGQEFILTEARGLMASAGARDYNGGLGAPPPAGFRGRAPGQRVRGAKPP